MTGINAAVDFDHQRYCNLVWLNFLNKAGALCKGLTNDVLPCHFAKANFRMPPMSYFCAAFAVRRGRLFGVPAMAFP